MVLLRKAGGMATNPRYKNGHLRRKHRERFKAMQAPCGRCQGRLGPIHYDEPSDSKHPLSFVIDEIRPISKWKQFGYSSPEEAAQDFTNLQAAHYICNSMKSDKVNYSLKVPTTRSVKLQSKRNNLKLDGKW